jgi:toxin CcdB
MRQFDVFENPVPRARRAYPYVAVLQSMQVDLGRDRVVGPMARSSDLPALAGRATPVVALDGEEYALLIPWLTTLPGRDLRSPRGNVEAHRGEIVAAIDFLFLGI